ncbi:MAG: DMT family transporter, partial [Verrucomicrobiota bacterium]|nr:DMT family transporter [Verrucomicrobiota bacterium]
AFIAGLGQGFGATTSRIAERIAFHDDILITGISQAFQRVFAGMVFLALIYSVKKIFFYKKTKTPCSGVIHWLIFAALFGPVCGVACFQESLRTMSSGESMAIVSTSPLILIPLAYIFEKDVPSKKSVAATFLAIIGIIGICLNL